MPRKSKKETAPAAETPVIEQDPTVETSTADWKWPEVTETRELIIKFSPEDEHALLKKIADKVGERDSKETAKSAMTAQFNGEIKRLDKEISELSTEARVGGGTSDVACRWVFETAGANEAGELIPDASHKTLVRIDTGKVVQVSKLTTEDRQGDLLHGLHDQSEDQCLASLTEYGASIGERETPEEGQSAFYLVHADGTETDLVADNRLAALRAALTLLTEADANADALLLGIEEDGRAARNDGKASAENPYEDEDTAEHKAWHQGWLTPNQNGSMFQEEETAVA